MSDILVEKTLIDACIIALTDLAENINGEDVDWVMGLVDRLEIELVENKNDSD